MTIVEGQIETLKHLKESLRKNGVTRFNSIGEIRNFTKSFKLEEEQLPIRIERAVSEEIKAAELEVAALQQSLNELETGVLKDIQQQIVSLNAELHRIRDKSNKSSLLRAVFFPRKVLLARKASRLDKNVEKIVSRKTKGAGKKVAKLEKGLEHLRTNRDKVVSKRCEEALNELTHTKQVVDGLYTLVAGAVGETAVVNTLQQLSDEYYLINDFSLRFKRPIYNRRENDRIYSIQIDHLLVCNAGVFVLETKNWSKASVKSLDLRSPVKQILRSSFALFVLLNSDSRRNGIKLRRHHWGAKRIPIRNLIVMINSKPKEQFNHVKVLSLNELIGYIRYFDKIFDGDDVRQIYGYLKGQM